MRQIIDLDVVALASALRSRRLSALQVTDAYLARITATEPRLNAYIAVFAETARARARALDRARPSGHLHGVPIAIKDLIDERGRVTTAGSRLRHAVARRDAPLVTRLRAAGAVFLGRTNLHEFAFGTTTANPHFGSTRNPHDLARIPGGSSGGSAAAVAAGSAAAALGTDTGGSVRIPAALCGVVGLKPTYDTVPREGVEPLAWSLDHVGPITRSTRDAGLLFDVLSGQRPTTLRPGARRIRVGIHERYFYAGLDAAVRAGCDAARAALRDAGAREVSVRIPHVQAFWYVQRLVLGAEAAAAHEDDLRRHAGQIGANVRRRLRASLGVSAIDYLRAQRVRSLLIEEVDAALRSCDVLLVPTAAVSAPQAGRIPRVPLTRFTSPFNLTGHPALAVPSGVDARGLPVSVQVVGRHFDEATILRVGAAIEHELALDLRPAL